MTDVFPIIEVPIIPPDLRQEESLIQIADCLDYLNKATVTVFECINSRIRENRKKINGLKERLFVAQTKVEKLKGIKKATQIFSTSKYPAGDVLQDYVSVFNGASKIILIPSNTKVLDKHLPSKNKLSVEDKLQFFHVKEARKNSDIIHLNEELEDLPAGIEFVSSLLLFNTPENPYVRYVTHDSMRVVNKLSKNNEDSLQKMEAAPISISKQEELNENISENYFYSPSLGDVPNIDAPLDLPDLPGIADDLRYSLDLGPGFAPSVITTPACPDLPTIPEDCYKDLKLEDKTQIKQALLLPSPPPPPPPPPSSSSSSPPQPPQQPFIPPPPPPPSLPSVDAISCPPPPPPPPPLPQIEAHLQGKNETSTSPAVIYATSTDARANLMAAIRNAGGKAKLRPIQSGRDESKRIRDEKILVSSGGDLMADLHNKLLLRRKGISGNKEPPGMSAMDKVSAMIPPPVHCEPSSATEDDEWEE